ncbi:MAG: C39 family peptidase [Pirellulaceae bacterium]
MMRLRYRLFLGALSLLLNDLAAVQSVAYESVLIEGVPHVRQKPDFCGEACAEMFLAKLGSKIDQDFVFDQSGLDPIEGRGCWTRELSTALRRIGFQTGNVRYRVSARDADRQMEAQFRALHADLVAGVPSVLCMHYDDKPRTTEHFRLILGYDEDTDEVIYHEPAVNRGAYQRMKREMLLTLWPLKYEPQRWTVVRFRLEPGRIVNGRADTTLTDADYAQHILGLKEKLATLKERQIELKEERDAETKEEAEKAKKAKEEGEDYEPQKLKPRIVSEFSFVIEKPFVVVGDDTPARVRRHSQGTIRWAVRRLKESYFNKDPDHVITIWLFKDKQSYDQNVLDIFHRRPHTPFGYYSSWQKALVMNIDTGGGTLVHEIVHPFIAANFPDCPSWLNEGLGSLYEQCHDRNGRIWGRTNWRLRGLQEAIEDEDYEMPTFEELCSTTVTQFYDRDPGTNYAQARYLLYYLQHRGLLRKYYHEFLRSAGEDPTGYETLQRILGEEDMETFQETWSEFVLDLRY